jgi:hypothetical protein
MNPHLDEPLSAADPAAVFACALSLWQECEKHALNDKKLNLSESYNGYDQFTREVMRVATLFENWSCDHINFDNLNDVWPYLLQGKFGETCLSAVLPNALAVFNDDDCLRVALRLRLPVKVEETLPVPVDLTANNPITNSTFKKFRIQTVRDSSEDGDTQPFTADDEPFDENFAPPYFALYGIADDGLLEHIADRRTYSAALTLAQKLAPGVEFPTAPVLFTNDTAS